MRCVKIISQIRIHLKPPGGPEGQGRFFFGAGRSLRAGISRSD